MSRPTVLNGDPIYQALPDGRRKLLKPLRVDLGQPIPGLDGVPGVTYSSEGTMILEVPTGFETDFSSIPRLALTLMGSFEHYDIPGVCHDYLYEIGAPRGPSDQVWRILVKAFEAGVDSFRAVGGWLGLRLGGWWRYAELESVRRGSRHRAARIVLLLCLLLAPQVRARDRIDGQPFQACLPSGEEAPWIVWEAPAWGSPWYYFVVLEGEAISPAAIRHTERVSRNRAAFRPEFCIDVSDPWVLAIDSAGRWGPAAQLPCP